MWDSSETPEASDQAGSEVPKHRAEIADPGSRQQGVAQGVRRDVGIRVARQAGLAGPQQPGQPHRAARGVGMDVGADADKGVDEARSDGTGSPPPGEDGLGHHDVEWASDLEGLLVAGNHVDRNPESLDEAGIVGDRGLVEVGGGVGTLQDPAVKP